MDETDRKILNMLQRDFPIEAEPFRRIGEKVGLSEAEVLKRVEKLKDEGIIRRIGAVFVTKKLGYASTLCAAEVPEETIGNFIDVVNSYKGVTHNYRRNHRYNIWFTLIASSDDEIGKILGEIEDKTGISGILDMRATKQFKIDATFDM
ncbi:MAG: AsnC family transcriptional regulator [Deltaproteobacteria bacterium]|nr:AsnC family transcriptional regulator [Deltaproteobacteria bacterium]MBN2845137.1 AsnC family transcriptional regulator [Deltaproteobacteria bacterium]